MDAEAQILEKIADFPQKIWNAIIICLQREKQNGIVIGTSTVCWGTIRVHENVTEVRQDVHSGNTKQYTYVFYRIFSYIQVKIWRQTRCQIKKFN